MLTTVEVLGTSAVTEWARNGSLIACCTGIFLFALLGALLGVCVHAVDHMNTVNAAWQSTSIACVSVLSVLFYDEPITPIQCLGVVLACAASLCFL